MEVIVNAPSDDKNEIIEVSGRIDAITVGDFEEKVLPLCSSEENASAFIIDFSKLVYISSAGLRAILKIAKSCNEKGKKMAVCNLSPDVREVFKISGFDLIITVCDDLESAKKAIA